VLVQAINVRCLMCGYPACVDASSREKAGEDKPTTVQRSLTQAFRHEVNLLQNDQTVSLPYCLADSLAGRPRQAEGVDDAIRD